MPGWDVMPPAPGGNGETSQGILGTSLSSGGEGSTEVWWSHGEGKDRDEEQQGRLRAAAQGQPVPVLHVLHVLLSLQQHQPLQAEENQTEPQILIQFSLQLNRPFPTAPSPLFPKACFPKPDISL